ncbi:MAG: Asp23/Gls24 family envelope stress response protein [Oscillospiraceae bacterium]|nr:Asp23/Gls24 family envelope stress response protein [Oscillospiraceae bacterium]
METKNTRPVGSIKVSDSVILKIAEVAATEIDGVDAVGQQLAPASAKTKMFGAVRCRLNGESVSLALDIVVLDGFNAVNVAESVQKSVKSAVQSMTGFTVTRVDVNVAGIKFKQ